MGASNLSHGIPGKAPVAAKIKAMLARGDGIVHIAAYFGLNPAWVRAVQSGCFYPEVPPAPTDALPPPGPYKDSSAYAALHALREAEQRLERNAVALSLTSSPH